MANVVHAVDGSAPLPIARTYPGEGATGEDVLRLADEYRKAAEVLRKDPSVPGPCRLLAIHAIELYLNAFLLHAGQEHSRVRGMQHDLTTRALMVVARGLQLRKKTQEHLSAIHENREYLVTRYEPEMTAVSQPNRLTATLEEVAKKVAEKVRPGSDQAPGRMPDNALRQ